MKYYNFFALLLYLTRAPFGFSITSSDCSPCVCTGGTVVCDKEGTLRAFPTGLSTTTETLIIWNQNFSDPILRATYLYPYAASLKRLVIRNSRLKTIVPGAFHSLRRIKEIVLTGNEISEIQADTFSGLRIKVLKLADNHGLRIWDTSFRNASVEVLSLAGCQIKKVTLSLFQPLLPGLTHLLLGRNAILELPAGFEKLAYQQLNLDVSENPLNCTCEIQWLSKYLSSGKLNSDYEDQVKKTLCYYPPHLRGVAVDSLVRQRLLSCHALSIQSIDIYFITGDTCQIRCQVQGPTGAIELRWDGPGLPGELEGVPGNGVERLSDNAMQSSVTVKRRDSAASYTCSARTGDSSTSLDIRINWPNVSHESGEIGVPRIDERRLVSPSGGNLQVERHFFFRPRHSLLELFGAILFTFVATVLLFVLFYRFFCRHSKTQRFQNHNSVSSSSQVGGNSGGVGLLYQHSDSHRGSQKLLPTFSPQPVYDGYSADSSQVYDMPTNNNLLLQQNGIQPYTHTLSQHHPAAQTLLSFSKQPLQQSLPSSYHLPQHDYRGSNFAGTAEKQPFIDFKTQQQLR